MSRKSTEYTASDSFIGPAVVNIGPRDLWAVGKEANKQCVEENTFTVVKFNFTYELEQF